jgi:hypothetical protein
MTAAKARLTAESRTLLLIGKGIVSRIIDPWSRSLHALRSLNQQSAFINQQFS